MDREVDTYRSSLSELYDLLLDEEDNLIKEIYENDVEKERIGI